LNEIEIEIELDKFQANVALVFLEIQITANFSLTRTGLEPRLDDPKRIWVQFIMTEANKSRASDQDDPDLN